MLVLISDSRNQLMNFVMFRTFVTSLVLPLHMRVLAWPQNFSLWSPESGRNRDNWSVFMKLECPQGFQPSVKFRWNFPEIEYSLASTAINVMLTLKDEDCRGEATSLTSSEEDGKCSRSPGNRSVCTQYLESPQTTARVNTEWNSWEQFLGFVFHPKTNFSLI